MSPKKPEECEGFFRVQPGVYFKFLVYSVNGVAGVGVAAVVFS